MTIIRQEFERYFAEKYPFSRIDTEHTLSGKVTIRFNVSENESLDTENRIVQAIKRGTLIWHELFGKSKNSICVIIYEYTDEEIVKYKPEYLFQQFNSSSSNEFVSSDEAVNSRMIIGIDQNGNEVFEKVMAKITIGKVDLQSVNIENILLGIANRDNSLDPIIGQSVYFLNPTNDTAFHFPDDRGFFIWAYNANHLRKIYDDHITWISEDTKEDIEPYFQ